ncbi:MAG: hypothetical protein QOE70_6385 [Chthoniobacter sp.]|jgi:thiol:disulfide interchange protein DsbD|nr:hypothetical protein [Chthoniobacter sp.]
MTCCNHRALPGDALLYDFGDMNPRPWLLSLASFAACAVSSWAQPGLLPAGLGDKTLLIPNLVADTTKIAPGKPFTVGVRLQLAPGWHTYWQYQGESGAPLRIDWQLPEGFKAGPIQWPIPHSRVDEGDLLTYIYESEVLLLVEITPPASLPAGEVTLQAKLRWLVCEKTCVPGAGEVALALPTGADGAPANADLFARWRALLPKARTAPFAIKWERKTDSVTLQIQRLPPETKTEFFPLPPPSVILGHPKLGEIAPDGSRSITIPIQEGGSPTLPWKGVLVTTTADGGREGWTVAAGAALPAASPTAAVAAPVGAGGGGGFALKLLAAFLGGLIMNVMPCVLPVIALKIFGFVHQAGEAPARVFRLGLAFNAGVFTFFLGLAAVVARLKTAFNWGYQFQNPYLLAGLIALIFIFSLSLLGVFELALTGGAANTLGELSRREGYGGAFLHGLFTTLLGTSCTAPFLGTSLGFAVTQSTPVIFLLFAAIAAGMSLPYFLLTVHPAWLRFVPKPGLWMERVKQLMGFAMLAVAVWLFGILGLRGPHVVAGMSWFLLVVGLACWLFGVFRESRLGPLALVALPVVGYFTFLDGKLDAANPASGKAAVVMTGSIVWEPFSDERLASGRQEGLPVFIDFTADWCVNCKAYEGLVLANGAVGDKFREKKVVALRADWTNTDDPLVTRALKSFGRVGVPLYVLYRPGEDAPFVTDALTAGTLLVELDKIKN